MPASTLTSLALEQAAERVRFLTAQSDRLSHALVDLADEIRDCHVALRAATAALRDLQATADVPVGVE